MAPLAPTLPKEQIKARRDAAQVALHSLHESGKKTEAAQIYAGMRVWVLYGWRTMSGRDAATLAKARQVLGTVPGEISGPINTYLSTPAKMLYDAKTDGFPGPPSTNPKGVGDLGDAASAAAGSIFTDLGGFLTALTQRNTWIRVGEGVLGLLLIGIGVAAITRGTAVGSAIRTGVNATPVGRVAKILK